MTPFEFSLLRKLVKKRILSYWNRFNQLSLRMIVNQCSLELEFKYLISELSFMEMLSKQIKLITWLTRLSFSDNGAAKRETHILSHFDWRIRWDDGLATSTAQTHSQTHMLPKVLRYPYRRLRSSGDEQISPKIAKPQALRHSSRFAQIHFHFTLAECLHHYNL